MERCFLCGKRIFLFYATVKVGTLEKKMHDGPIRGCADEYQDWENRPVFIGEIVQRPSFAGQPH